MNWLECNQESYNYYYNVFRASWCKRSGLPMYSKSDYWSIIVPQSLYTVTRAKREKIKIDLTKVFAWYRLCNGYTPLFKAVEDENQN